MRSRSTRGWQWRRWRSLLLVYVGIVLVIGVFAGIGWNRLVKLPSYTIGNDFRATIPESGLARIAATDVWYSLIGAAAGAIIGMVAWFLFRRLGWLVTVAAAVGALVAGFAARAAGEFIGPRGFDQRVALATRGDAVPIDFALHSWVPLAVWVALAMAPVAIGAALNRQDWISHVPSKSSDTDQAGASDPSSSALVSGSLASAGATDAPSAGASVDVSQV
ncbi:MAG: hypothetical protein LBV00_12955 [Propionibacteriaceae bacterium]|jgi:magnesium-transporting ATPase (P-type)|nr:hypothetical protein [Propionibacteriaceae bacterium]